MASKDIVPQQPNSQRAVQTKRTTAEHPILSLQREMNRLFDNFFSGFVPSPRHAWEEGLQAYNPRVDITETPKALEVTAELPGMKEDEVEITLTPDALGIKGEKHQEKEEKNKNYYRMERSYGSFQRLVPLPVNIDTSLAEATFKKGVLRVTLPKAGESRRDVKKIAVKSE